MQSHQRYHFPVHVQRCHHLDPIIRVTITWSMPLQIPSVELHYKRHHILGTTIKKKSTRLQTWRNQKIGCTIEDTITCTSALKILSIVMGQQKYHYLEFTTDNEKAQFYNRTAESCVLHHEWLPCLEATRKVPSSGLHYCRCEVVNPITGIDV